MSPHLLRKEGLFSVVMSGAPPRAPSALLPNFKIQVVQSLVPGGDDASNVIGCVCINSGSQLAETDHWRRLAASNLSRPSPAALAGLCSVQL